MPPPPVEARFLVRQIVLEVRIGGVVLDDVLWTRCRFGFAEPVASAQFMCPVRHGDYNDDVEIRCGALPGAGLYLRFKGRLRNPSGELWPRAVTHNVVGQLQRAAEYINGSAIPLGSSGMWLPAVLGRAYSATGGAPWTVGDRRATAAEIVRATLGIAGVPFDPADIQSTSIVYGTRFSEFIWQAGTPTGDGVGLSFPNPLAPTQPGETALAYIQRYDEIDAEWGGEANFQVGGFYRTSEGLGGRVYRVRVGGRPYSPWEFAFVESGPGANILDGSRMERQYPKGNRMIVSGTDYGAGGGAMRFTAQRNNPFMPQEATFYAPNPPSSSMIEWATDDMKLAAGYGQSCQTVAEAALLEANKETPAGQIISAEDAPFTQGISVLVAGTYDPATTASTPGRLLANEPFLIKGLTIDCGHGTEGEPNFVQTLEVEGGGLDPNPNPPPDWGA